MKKTFFVFLLEWILLFACWRGAIAQSDAFWDDNYTSPLTSHVEIFEQNIPDALCKILDTYGFTENVCRGGATLHTIINDVKPQSTEHSISLIALETGDENCKLVGIHLSGNGRTRVTPFDKEIVPKGRTFTVGVVRDGGLMGQYFTLTFPLESGSTETYGLWTAWNPALWYIQSYTRTDENGDGFRIVAKPPEYGFHIYLVAGNKVVEDASFPEFLPAYIPLWVDYMHSLDDFPTSKEEALYAAETSWNRLDGKALALTINGKLYAEPDNTTSSLGKYADGLLVQTLPIPAGTPEGWAFVRVGHVEGYMPQTALHLPRTSGFARGMWGLPLPVACTHTETSLRMQPTKNASSIHQLPKGTLTHVIGQTEGNWLHVMVPQGDMTWEAEGISGYLPRDAVTMHLTMRQALWDVQYGKVH